jgi:hypothetical protein
LVAAQLQGAAIVIMPRRCESIDEWLARYAPKKAHADGAIPCRGAFWSLTA